MITYQVGGALLGLGLAIADFFILRLAWNRAADKSTSGIKWIAVAGFVILPVLGWFQGKAIFESLQ